MKKLIAISFLFVFLSANTELNQLLRLPILIHHFLEHHEQEPDETFTDFLNEHYSADQSLSNHEHHDHDNLPFKTTHCSVAHASLAFVSQIQYSIPKPIILYDKISPVYNGSYYSSAVGSNIWQPPKIR